MLLLVPALDSDLRSAGFVTPVVFVLHWGRWLIQRLNRHLCALFAGQDFGRGDEFVHELAALVAECLDRIIDG